MATKKISTTEYAAIRGFTNRQSVTTIIDRAEKAGKIADLPGVIRYYMVGKNRVLEFSEKKYQKYLDVCESKHNLAV